MTGTEASGEHRRLPNRAWRRSPQAGRADRGGGSGRVLALVAVVTVLTGAAAGCSSPGGPDIQPSAVSGLAQTAWRPAGYDQVREGGAITIGLGTFPATFNLNHQATSAVTAAIQGPTLSNGLRYAADGSWSPDPAYVESMRLSSTDPQRVEVHLNRKAVWSDGTPITYRDLASNVAAMSGRNKKYQVGAQAGYEDIGTVSRGSDDYSYTVTFTKKNADWPHYVYPLMPAGVTDTPDSFNSGYQRKPIPANGPFLITSVDERANVVTAERNPRWWGRSPKLERIVFRQVGPASAGQSFANGELDAVDTRGNVDVLSQAQQRAGAQVQRSAGRSWTHLTMNGSTAPLDNVAVRKAIAQAIDRQAFATVTQKGLGAAPVTQGSVLLVPGQKGYTDIFGPALPYSKEAAERSLQQAGYTKDPGSGRYGQGGRPLSVGILYQSDTPSGAQRAQLLQAALQGIGITATLDPAPANVFGQRLMTRNFNLVTFSWTGDPWPLSSAQPLYFPKDSPQNFSGITDPSLQSAWAAADSEFDPARRLELTRGIERTIAGYLPIVPLATEPIVMVIRPNLVNYGAAQFETVDWTQVGLTE